MITAIVQITDPVTKQKTLFKKERDGLPVKVQTDLYGLATDCALTHETFVERIGQLPYWQKLDTVPKDLFLACDYLFEAQVYENRFNLHEKRQD